MSNLKLIDCTLYSVKLLRNSNYLLREFFSKSSVSSLYFLLKVCNCLLCSLESSLVTVSDSLLSFLKSSLLSCEGCLQLCCLCDSLFELVAKSAELLISCSEVSSYLLNSSLVLCSESRSSISSCLCLYDSSRELCVLLYECRVVFVNSILESLLSLFKSSLCCVLTVSLVYCSLEVCNRAVDSLLLCFNKVFK